MQVIYTGLQCICRMSKKLLRKIKKFVNKQNTLIFIEVLFTTLCQKHNLTIINPPEFINVVFNQSYNTVYDINSNKFYHTIKNILHHCLLHRPKRKMIYVIIDLNILINNIYMEINTKILVIYVLHEMTYLADKFFNNAIFKDENVHFLVVCNKLSLKLNLPSYVEVINRENIGHDFGAWSQGLLTHTEYDYYICVNSSADGPYMPLNYTKKWTDIYIDGLKENNIKLFGSTINCCIHKWTSQYEYLHGPHVQSYIFSMSNDTMKYLSSEGIFSLTEFISDKIKVIFLKEILLSKKILDK